MQHLRNLALLLEYELDAEPREEEEQPYGLRGDRLRPVTTATSVLECHRVPP